MTNSETDKDQHLLHLIKKGKDSAIKELYDSYVRYFTAICSRYILNEEDVKDVLQDSFMKIFSSIHTFEYRGSGSLKGWMTRIVVNETLKFIQRNSKVEFVELTPETIEKEEDDPNTEGIPSSVIYRMIRELPDGYRAVFNLYVIEEKSHKEIAELLHIKESSSASQLHRAKALLADKINNYRKLNLQSV